MGPLWFFPHGLGNQFYISTPGSLFMVRVSDLSIENSKTFSKTKYDCFSSSLLWCVVALNIETF